jgi:hypothetical protein
MKERDFSTAPESRARRRIPKQGLTQIRRPV